MGKKSFCVCAKRGENSLFAMARPGLIQPLEDDLRMLQGYGIGAIVTLTEEELFLPLPYRKLFHTLHLPIENLEPPTMKQVKEFVQFVDDMFDRGIDVAVHCLMGIGRTGTMIACYRVSLGEKPDDAISNMRSIRNFIETKEQEEIVAKYYKRKLLK